ncbi:N-acetyltransferase [archaeon]|nr:MAG: N-acetyltransferase [archaeon]
MPDGSAGKRLYIVILAVLAPYRGRGIGTTHRACNLAPRRRACTAHCACHPAACCVAGSQMVNSVVDAAMKHADVKEIFLHVQSNNEEAQKFYERLGFARGEEVKGYYRGITPPDAFIYSKKLVRA